VQKGPDAFVVTVIEEPAKDLTVADLLVNSLSLAGVLVLVSIVLGGLAGWILVAWNRRRRPERHHLPPVNPLIADPTAPRTSRVP